MEKVVLLLPFLVMFIGFSILVLIILLFLKQSKILVNEDNLSNKFYLKSQIKSTGTAYLLLFFFGFHYIYMNRLVLQILYWITIGGLGVWTIIDLVTLSNRISTHNALLYKLIDELENKEKV